MSIINEIKHEKEALRYKDRQEAVRAITRKLYYEVEPCTRAGDTFDLFVNEIEAMNFCKENKLNKRVFDEIIKELETEGMLYGYKLTERGVYKLCLERQENGCY